MKDLEKRVEKLERQFDENLPYKSLNRTQAKLRDLQYSVVGWGITLFLGLVAFVNTTQVFEIFKSINTSPESTSSSPSVHFVKICLFLFLVFTAHIIWVVAYDKNPKKRFTKKRVMIYSVITSLIISTWLFFGNHISQCTMYNDFTLGIHNLFNHYFLGVDNLVRSLMMCGITFTALHWWIRITRNVQKYIKLTIPKMDDDNPTILSEGSLEKCLCGIFHATTLFIWGSILW